MGNGLAPCLHLPAVTTTTVRLVYWGGQARLVAEEENGCVVTAGDVAAELPAAEEHVICPADSFFVGLPIPVMSPGEELLPGRTYFVLPATRFSCLKVLTAATLAALSPGPKKVPLAGPGQCPFEYVKGAGGAALIRVLPEFIEKVITCDNGNGNNRRSCGAADDDGLCSTPELKRHYAQLVGSRNRQPWSPRLETISECDHKSRWFRSPARLLSSR
ncbi:hypothetical protein QOZ80_1AG0046840 [Eleusine coracana subsp. coracana]|nr:hypothetical protein QOZ80_1AG0046840 [Eleusine coracana subsp. coracana]